jgi:hypothetical protein
MNYVELLALSDNQQKQIAELEKECVNAKNYMVDLSKTIINYSSQIEKLEMKVLEYSIALSAPDEIRDLEQQAKALFDFEVDENIGSVACDQVTQSLKDKSYEFSNQAKALKDQGK